MKLVSPRVIRGNRGDLLSRYGILSELYGLGIKNLTVFCFKNKDIYPLEFRTVNYGHIYNLIPSYQGLKELIKSDVVLWTGGIDLQDDSSLVKLIHTLIVFIIYRMMRLKIYIIMQGAGPLTTKWGRRLAQLILNRVNVFVTRDKGSLKLLQELNSRTRLMLGYDGIFLGDFGKGRLEMESKRYIEKISSKKNSQPLIGFNIRMWFHFTGSLLPFQYAKQKYLNRSEQKMTEFVNASTSFLEYLRSLLDAKILLISMYEPDVEPWEDDLFFLQRIKKGFSNDPDVALVNEPLDIHSFCHLLSGLDLMVGTRLHSTIAAMRLGVPAINLNYTLKGRDIFKDLGLENQVINLDDFISDPGLAVGLVQKLVKDVGSRKRTNSIVEKTIQKNRQVLHNLFINIQ
ncbi:polysaccharide pyruvyl transferase family protein [Thermodesulfobacteriota bacterium]